MHWYYFFVNKLYCSWRYYCRHKGFTFFDKLYLPCIIVSQSWAFFSETPYECPVSKGLFTDTYLHFLRWCQRFLPSKNKFFESVISQLSIFLWLIIFYTIMSQYKKIYISIHQNSTGLRLLVLFCNYLLLANSVAFKLWLQVLNMIKSGHSFDLTNINDLIITKRPAVFV